MTAQEAYENDTATLRRHCADLECAILDHCDRTRSVTWAAVGDLRRFDTMLTELIALVRGEDK